MLKTETLGRLTHRVALHGGFDAATLTGNTTLTKKSGQVQLLDPGGNHRDVTLPTVSVDDDGYFVLIVNKADLAENLVIKNAAAATVATANQNEAALLYVKSDGTWALACIFTIAIA